MGSLSDKALPIREKLKVVALPMSSTKPLASCSLISIFY